MSLLKKKDPKGSFFLTKKRVGIIMIKKGGDNMTRTKKRGRKSKCPKKIIFENLYYTQELTAKEIGLMYDVNEQTVYNWAHKFRNESNLSDSENKLSDKQIIHCINSNIKKERSKA